MEYFVLLVRFISPTPVENLMLPYEIILPSKLFEICEEGLITLPLKNKHSFKKIQWFVCGFSLYFWFEYCSFIIEFLLYCSFPDICDIMIG